MQWLMVSLQYIYKALLGYIMNILIVILLHKNCNLIITKYIYITRNSLNNSRIISRKYGRKKSGTKQKCPC